MTSGISEYRPHGVLVDWNDQRGFGFIEPSAGGPRLFAHVSAFPRGRRPATGCEVTYVEARDDRNRLRASEVRYLVPPRRNVVSRPVMTALGVAAAFGVVLAALVRWSDLPVTVPIADAVLSVVALLIYADDKSAAQKGEWRTPEVTLHLVALVGGWPGALLARQLFRHKTRKQPFRTIFWLTVLVNCAALWWLVTLAPPLPLP